MATTRVVGLPRLQTLYRRFVGLDLNKSRAKEILDIAEKKLNDIFEVAVERAKEEGREKVKMRDLPLTKGFKRTMQRYETKRENLDDPRLDISPILNFLQPTIGTMILDEQVKEKLPTIAATTLLLIGYIIKEVDPKARTPSKDDVKRAKQILDLTL